MKTNNLIDLRRVRESREHAGEWRILRAKIRHVIDRTCALAAKVASDADEGHAIDRVRTCMLEYIDGRPVHMTPFELATAVMALFQLENRMTHDRAAA